MIFERDFNNLTEQDIKLLNSYFDGYEYESSTHTFLANYIWRDTHDLTWQVIGDYLCIAGMGTMETGDKQYFMSFPLTNSGSYDAQKVRETIAAGKGIFEAKGEKFELSLIPDSLVPVLKEAFGDGVEVEHTRDDDDYIYLKEDLISLKGRKLHNKKNHLNYFLRNNEFVYEEITPQIAGEVMEYIRSKNEYKLGETPEEWKDILELETVAIEELLNFVGSDTVQSGIIRINGKIVAVTIGEFAKTNSKETIVVHVEKADDRIRGLYQAINNEFCKRLPEETVFVNREEDMGLENLRQTKESYKPIKMAEKYTATFK